MRSWAEQSSGDFLQRGWFFVKRKARVFYRDERWIIPCRKYKGYVAPLELVGDRKHELVS